MRFSMPEKKEQPRPKGDNININTQAGKALRELRKRANLTQLEASIVLNCARTSVTNKEIGGQVVNLSDLELMANTIGLELVISFDEAMKGGE